MASAYLPAHHTDAKVIDDLAAKVKASVAAGKLDPWCRLCKSKAWHFEVGQTRFQTMEEAMPHLVRMQTSNLMTAELLMAGLVKDPQVKSPPSTEG